MSSYFIIIITPNAQWLWFRNLPSCCGESFFSPHCHCHATLHEWRYFVILMTLDLVAIFNKVLAQLRGGRRLDKEVQLLGLAGWKRVWWFWLLRRCRSLKAFVAYGGQILLCINTISRFSNLVSRATHKFTHKSWFISCRRFCRIQFELTLRFYFLQLL